MSLVCLELSLYITHFKFNLLSLRNPEILNERYVSTPSRPVHQTTAQRPMLPPPIPRRTWWRHASTWLAFILFWLCTFLVEPLRSVVSSRWNKSYWLCPKLKTAALLPCQSMTLPRFCMKVPLKETGLPFIFTNCHLRITEDIMQTSVSEAILFFTYCLWFQCPVFLKGFDLDSTCNANNHLSL